MSWADLPDRIGRERIVYEDEHVLLVCAPYQNVIGKIGHVDACITDAPYSDVTHAGHDGVLNRGQYKGPRGPSTLRDPAKGRRKISYKPWTDQDVIAACVSWCTITRGWIVSITDHVLAPIWKQEIARWAPPEQEQKGCGDSRWENRYTFAPLQFMDTGSRVRLTGDGPALWSVQIVVGRPKYEPYSKWGSLPGGYVMPPGQTDYSPLVGGKPLWLMRELVSDYSREGDLILDPCAGGGTTGRAAKDLGRRAILIEQDPQTCELAAKVLKPHRAWQGELELGA